MDLRQLECVVAVARHEHVTRAAEHLHLTQSAVSQHLLRLEAELGTRLFERGPRGTVPTAAGRELLQRAEAILAAVAEARDVLAVHAGAGPAVVRVLAAPGEAPGLDAVLAGADLLDRVALRHADAATVADELRRGAAELGVAAVAGPAPAGLDAVPLRPDPLVVLRAATGPGAATGTDLAALRERPVLLPARGTAARAVAVAAFAGAGFSPLPRFEVADPQTARRLVAAGAAVGIVPASWAGAGVAAEPLPAAEPVRPVLLHRPDPSPAAAAVAAALRAALG